MFFKGIDWTQVYLQKYSPPLIPPRGEVNAADAFDIGSFDEEDTKGIKVSNITECWRGGERNVRVKCINIDQVLGFS